MRRLLRIVGYLALAVVVLVFLAAGGIWFAGGRAFAARISVPPETFDARDGNVDRGKHFVMIVANCSGCHRANLGGGSIIDDPNVAVIDAPNLTAGAGGIGAKFSDTDFERAIRHGVAPDGTALAVMPSEMYSAFSDADLRDVIAYVRSVPPVNRTTKPRAIGFMGRLGIVLGKFSPDAYHIDQSAAHVASLPPAANASYGRYLVRLGNCTSCHKANFAGGKVFDMRVANITPAAIGSWTLAQFEQTLRTGRDPSGHRLSTQMPWPEIGQMNDQELTAVYLFLKTVPPVTQAKT
ncbi:MAG: cytochrome c [Candidatus Eremiobacteraeota bacterium]|nr:cytochrome c [Candidatus Eremiobacteraeota bacterium]